MSDLRKLDLNIDKVLESWEPAHAIRELIANAIDEQILTDTADIEIEKIRDGVWTVRDYGRGLNCEHFVQSENPEKLASTKTIGKFGVGLKDALATLWRNDIIVTIQSRHGFITLERASKHSFDNLLTLHACVVPARDPSFEGTLIKLEGCADAEILAAKKMFLRFSNASPLEATDFGCVLQQDESTQNIFLNGLKIADEENFLFSYNITSPNAAIRKAINRERMNVGRSAYSDRVKSILTACTSELVREALAADLKNVSSGRNRDELNWLEVQTHACELLSESANVVFVTAEERTSKASLVEYASSDGLEAVTIPERLKQKVSSIQSSSAVIESPVRTLAEYTKTFNVSFEYQFVELHDLTSAEREIFDQQQVIFDSLGGRPNQIRMIKVSETMRPNDLCGFDAYGVWLQEQQMIVLKRSTLEERCAFHATLLHEIAHATSGASDLTMQFESELTRLLGVLAAQAVRERLTVTYSFRDDEEIELMQLENESLGERNALLARKLSESESALTSAESVIMELRSKLDRLTVVSGSERESSFKFSSKGRPWWQKLLKL